MIRRLIYLHGFRSSPRSTKALQTQDALRQMGLEHLLSLPALDISPARAVAQIEALARGFEPDELAVIGSSLGGFYATWLAERYGCRTALINPAIAAPRDLAPWLGRHQVYHSDAWVELRPEHLEELRQVDTPVVTRHERYLLLAATGDEVIDWREMVGKYNGCRMHLTLGGNHAFETYPTLIRFMFEFLGLAGPGGAHQPHTHPPHLHQHHESPS